MWGLSRDLKNHCDKNGYMSMRSPKKTPQIRNGVIQSLRNFNTLPSLHIFLFLWANGTGKHSKLKQKAVTVTTSQYACSDFRGQTSFTEHTLPFYKMSSPF